LAVTPTDADKASVDIGERLMNLDVIELETGIKKVTLSGRWDVQGALKVDEDSRPLPKKVTRW
jgi:hypothetical protein